MRPQLSRVTEPDENTIHYSAPDGLDQVTLCGMTDFIGHKQKGAATDEAPTCWVCMHIFDFIQGCSPAHRPATKKRKA
jgi:hypothetical protein